MVVGAALAWRLASGVLVAPAAVDVACVLGLLLGAQLGDAVAGLRD